MRQPLSSETERGSIALMTGWYSLEMMKANKWRKS